MLRDGPPHVGGIHELPPPTLIMKARQHLQGRSFLLKRQRINIVGADVTQHQRGVGGERRLAETARIVAKARLLSARFGRGEAGAGGNSGSRLWRAGGFWY